MMYLDDRGIELFIIGFDFSVCFVCFESDRSYFGSWICPFYLFVFAHCFVVFLTLQF